MNLSAKNVDYTYARRSGSNDPWERIVDSEGPYEEDGSMGAPDCFKLEYSGWATHIEFKPK
jgi:hypothetical protein